MNSEEVLRLYCFYAIIHIGGDILKFNKPNIWIMISYIYLIFLLIIMLIYNPDFSEIKNCLLFIPLYIPIFISSYIKHKNDEYAESFIWGTKWSLIVVTAVVAVFRIIVNCLK